MPAFARIAAPAAADTAASRIAAFLNGFSLEATAIGEADIAALQGVVPLRMPVYLTSVPGQPAHHVIEPARRLRMGGFEPVPHIAVRNIESDAVFDDLLSSLAALAGVRRILVIAGDRERPAGRFASALDLIESGRLQRYGITEIGIAGYPEGHPRISTPVLQQALVAKIEAAEQTGLKVHIVTQFCFDPHAVIGWIERLRDLGIEHPVRIGLAGPANLSTLLHYAQRCGVRASVLGLTKHAGLLKHLIGTSAPDGMIRPLAEAAVSGRLGQAAPHFYSFGGVAATGRWAAAARAGHIVLDRADGFRVEPP